MKHEAGTVWNMREYGFSQTCILSYKDGSVFTRENKG